MILAMNNTHTNLRTFFSALLLLSVILAANVVQAYQFCSHLPKNSSAFYSCEALNQRERFERERKDETQAQMIREYNEKSERERDERKSLELQERRVADEKLLQQMEREESNKLEATQKLILIASEIEGFMAYKATVGADVLEKLIEQKQCAAAYRLNDQRAKKETLDTRGFAYMVSGMIAKRCEGNAPKSYRFMILAKENGIMFADFLAAATATSIIKGDVDTIERKASPIAKRILFRCELNDQVKFSTETLGDHCTEMKVD
jgi:hypothetical protein